MKVSPRSASLRDQKNHGQLLTIVAILRPVIQCLKLFGIYVCDESGGGGGGGATPLRRAHGYAVFIVVNVHFVALAGHVCRQIYVDDDDNDDDDSIANRSSLVHVMTNAIIQLTVYNVLYFRQRSVGRLLDVLQDIQRVSCRHSIATFGKAKLYVNIEVLVVACRKVLTVVVYCLASIVYAKDLFPVVYKNSGHRPLEIGLLYLWFIGGLFFFSFFTMYIVVCIVLSSSLDNISSKRMTTDDWTATATDAMSPVRYHGRLCDGVDETNAVFSESLFICSACQLAAILFYLREMNLHLATVNVEFENVTFLVETLVRFAVVNVYAGKVNSKILTSLTEFNDADNLMQRQLYNNKSSIMAKVLLYKRRIILQPPGLSGWSLYAPSKMTVVLAASNVLTYVLVLYRLTKPPPPPPSPLSALEELLPFPNGTGVTNVTNATDDGSIY